MSANLAAEVSLASLSQREVGTGVRALVRLMRERGLTVDDSLSVEPATSGPCSTQPSRRFRELERTLLAQLASQLPETELTAVALGLGAGYQPSDEPALAEALQGCGSIRAAVVRAIEYFQDHYAFAAVELVLDEDRVRLRLDVSALPAPARFFVAYRDAAAAVRLLAHVVGEPVALAGLTDWLASGVAGVTGIAEADDGRPPVAPARAAIEWDVGSFAGGGVPRRLEIAAAGLSRAWPPTATPTPAPLDADAAVDAAPQAESLRHDVARSIGDEVEDVEDVASVGVAREDGDSHAAAPEERIAELVFAQLLAEPKATAGMDAVAQSLGISPRTLRRRLAGAGVGYRVLLARARLVRARELLRDTSMTLRDIADYLGYADTSSFHHSFRRQMGVTPCEFQRRAAGEVVGEVGEVGEVRRVEAAE